MSCCHDRLFLSPPCSPAGMPPDHQSGSGRSFPTLYQAWKLYYQNILVVCVGTILFGRFFGNQAFHKMSHRRTWWKLGDMRRNRRCVWTSIAWFNLKSRSLLLVYVGAISDSYTDYFLSRCLAKTTTELATTSMCKHKPKALFSGFADLQAFCGMFAGRFGRLFFVFGRFCANVLWTEK